MGELLHQVQKKTLTTTTGGFTTTNISSSDYTIQTSFVKSLKYG